MSIRNEIYKKYISFNSVYTALNKILLFFFSFFEFKPFFKYNKRLLKIKLFHEENN